MAAGLANGMTPRQLCAACIDNTGPAGDVVHPGVFFRQAWNELLQRLALLPA